MLGVYSNGFPVKYLRVREGFSIKNMVSVSVSASNGEHLQRNAEMDWRITYLSDMCAELVVLRTLRCVQRPQF